MGMNEARGTAGIKTLWQEEACPLEELKRPDQMAGAQKATESGSWRGRQSCGGWKISRTGSKKEHCLHFEKANKFVVGRLY